MTRKVKKKFEKRICQWTMPFKWPLLLFVFVTTVCLTLLYRFYEFLFFQVQKQLLGIIDSSMVDITVESLPFHILPLKHLCRLKIRSLLRTTGVKTTEKFLQTVDSLPLPYVLKNYLRYMWYHWSFIGRHKKMVSLFLMLLYFLWKRLLHNCCD